jgi:S1-C subfamily serine protease
MDRWICTLSVALTLVVGQASAAEPPTLTSALALQDAFQEAIRVAEPSIACVLVSRSDIYQRWFGHTIPRDNPGQLGGFNPETVSLRVPRQDYDQEMLNSLLKKKRYERFNPRDRNRELARAYDLSDPTNVPESYGSGVVINQKGLILTNYHVVQDATKVYVRLPGGNGSYADIYAADPRSDLAVLRLLDNNLRIKPIERGDGGQVRKGQLVLSLANPFASGYKDGQPSASWGIISNLRRRDPGASWWEQDRAKWTLHQYGTLIQTDARLNLGCSGGALIDLRGRLIGVTTALAAITGSETSGGYALPVDAGLSRIIYVLEKGEEVEYGFLGVGFDRELRGGGLPVTVFQGSPAERAEVKDRDVIVSVNGAPIRESDDLFLTVGTLLAGSEARLVVRSGGVERTVTARLDKFYVPGKIIATNRPQAVRGLRVEYTSILVQRDSSARLIPPGVFVREVQPGSPADRAQLQDAIITKVNGQAVGSPDAFFRAAQKAAGPLELTVLDRTESGGDRTVRLN